MERTNTLQQPLHFLFLLSDTTTNSEQEVIVNAAKELTSLGYVYVASPHEPTMADREDIRFMPLRSHQLPCFGQVTSVMIVRDPQLALAAREVYPDSHITVFDPAQATLAHEMSELLAADPAATPIPLLVPLMSRAKLPKAA